MATEAPEWLCPQNFTRSIWPIALDLIDWLRPIHSGKVLSPLADVIAPSFDQIVWPVADTPITRETIGAELDSDRIEKYLRNQLIRVLAGVADVLPIREEFGGRIDPSDAYIFAQCRALGGDPSRRPQPATTLEDLAWDDASEAERLVAASPQGIPLEVFQICEPLGSMTPSIVQVCGPDGARWLRMADRLRVRTKAADQADLVAMRRRLLAAWPSHGWHYVRRIALLLTTRPSAAEFRASFVPALFGTSGLWKSELLWPYLAAFVRQGLREKIARTPEVDWLGIAIAAGRIAPDRRREQISLILLQCAGRQWSETPIERARIAYERANILARMRVQPFLEQASDLLHRATVEIVDSLESREICEMRAQILNTRALVAYHAGRNDDALALEMTADTLARQSSDKDMEHWANVTLALNVARLVERRFGDQDRALSLLRPLIDNNDWSVRGQAACSVARLLCQREDWQGVIQTVYTALGPREEALLLDEEKVFLRVMRATALAASGQCLEAQRACGDISRANVFLRSESVSLIVAKLQAVLAPKLIKNLAIAS